MHAFDLRSCIILEQGSCTAVKVSHVLEPDVCQPHEATRLDSFNLLKTPFTYCT